MKAIETHYDGYRFRSRLEARWAVVFNHLGIAYDYEPEGYELPSGRYLPDFLLHLGDKPTWFEVKGDKATPRESALLGELCAATGRRALLAEGGIPRSNDDVGFYLYDSYDLDEQPLNYGMWDDSYRFALCPVCRRVGIEYEARADRVCNDCIDPTAGRYISDYTLIDYALQQGRSARFEHGESPR